MREREKEEKSKERREGRERGRREGQGRKRNCQIQLVRWKEREKKGGSGRRGRPAVSTTWLTSPPQHGIAYHKWTKGKQKKEVGWEGGKEGGKKGGRGVYTNTHSWLLIFHLQVNCPSLVS